MTETTTAGGQSVFVSDTYSLSQAYQSLSSNGGGTIYLTQGAEPYSIVLNDGGPDHVHIVSADPQDPVDLFRIKVDRVENVTVENVSVDSSHLPRPSWEDLEVWNSTGIVIKDSTFQSDAVTYMGEQSSSWQEAALVRNSTDVEISGNHFSNYVHGIFLRDSFDVVIENNDITQMQGDGLRMEGVQGVRIEGNDFYDFLGSPNSSNHDDMIQMWAMNTDIVSRDIDIIGNTFIANDDVASQTIFLGNEVGANNPDLFYENITIKDNVIYNGHLSGIRVFASRNVLVEDNTLLWNQDADLEGQNYPPEIFFTNIQNGEITNNITSDIRILGEDRYGDVAVSGNETVTYWDASRDDHVLKHFADFNNITDAGIADLALLPDSEWVGLGAAISQPGALDTTVQSGESGPQVPPPVVEEPAPETPAEEPAAEEPAEPPVAEEPAAPPAAEEPAAPPAMPDITDAFVAFDFADTGLEDLSGQGAKVQSLDESKLGADGYRIGGRENFSIDRGNSEIHEMRQFGIELTLDPVGDDPAGKFLYFHNVLGARIAEDGAVRFGLRTDEGVFGVHSDPGVFSDGGAHVVGIVYDDAEQSLKMLIDGEVVNETFASGVTAPKTYHGLHVGHPWESALEADIGSFYMGPDLAAAPQDETGGEPVAQGFFHEMVQAAPEEETSVAPSETTETTETTVEPVLVEETPVEETSVDQAPAEETAPPAAAADIVTVDFATREMDGTQTLESAEGNPVDMMDAAAGYRIGEGERLLVPQDSVDLGRMGSFRLEIEMGLDAVGSEGVFLEVPGLLEGAVEDDGHVFFELATKKGVFGIESTAPVFDDTETRSIALVYDREERSLEMYADNTLVGAATARGQTERDFESTITVGSRDADGLDAWVESFSFATGREAEAETYELPILPTADVTLEDLATEQIEQEQTAEDDAAGPEQMVA